MKYICCDELKKRHTLEVSLKENRNFIFRFDELYRHWQLIFVSAYDIYGRQFGVMNFCPWCGAELHQRLDWVYQHILFYEYGILEAEIPRETDETLIIREIIPKEFRDSSWWRNRKLFEKESYVYVPFLDNPIITSKEYNQLERTNFNDPENGVCDDFFYNYYDYFTANHLQSIRESWLNDQANGIRE